MKQIQLLFRQMEMQDNNNYNLNELIKAVIPYFAINDHFREVETFFAGSTYFTHYFFIFLFSPSSFTSIFSPSHHLSRSPNYLLSFPLHLILNFDFPRLFFSLSFPSNFFLLLTILFFLLILLRSFLFLIFNCKEPYCVFFGNFNLNSKHQTKILSLRLLSRIWIEKRNVSRVLIRCRGIIKLPI